MDKSKVKIRKSRTAFTQNQVSHTFLILVVQYSYEKYS